MSSNNIFDYNTTNNQPIHSFNYDRVDLIDEHLIKDFNRYDANVFYGLIEPFPTGEDTTVDLSNYQIPSLFNHVNTIGANSEMMVRYNAPVIDNPETRELVRSYGDCSIKSLVELSSKGMMGRQQYQYSDFMFCKHLGKVSNNYLITLRRFPFPCADHINYTLKDSAYERKTQQHLPDIGRMVTWIGTPGNEMSNILKYNFKMPFKEQDAELQESDVSGDDGGILGTLANMGHNKKYNKMVTQGIAGGGAQKYFKSALSPVMGKYSKSLDGLDTAPPYKNQDWTKHRDSNKVYGPINAIKKTHIPSSEGLTFKQDIKLTFDYEMRSFNGINGKTAFLDLLANILATTYTTGNFWGGGIRATGVSQSNIFSNLPIFKLGNDQPLTLSKVSDAFTKSISEMGKAMNGGTSIKSGGDVLNMIKNMGAAIGNMLLGGAINMLGRPQKFALNSLLSPAAVGLWHITIGNPIHPIMMMGDMILTDTTIEHYGPLGLDDFPTGLKVECTLTHAKPRDITKIEQMYLGGDYRIYTPMSGEILKQYEAAYGTKKQDESNSENVKEKAKVDKTQKSIDNVDAETSRQNNAQKWNEFTNENSKLSRILMQSFGLRNGRSLIYMSKEAAWGADPTNKNKDAEKNEDLGIYNFYDEDILNPPEPNDTEENI